MLKSNYVSNLRDYYQIKYGEVIYISHEIAASYVIL